VLASRGDAQGNVQGAVPAAGIPVAESKLVDLEAAAEDHPMPVPYVVKPVAEGSSVGVHIVTEAKNGPPKIILEQRERVRRPGSWSSVSSRAGN
jgi:D-alanine-D-alanine ligase-like ATP-grasp enzyme